MDVIYLDICKAFDTVPHNRLLMKLGSFNIGGLVWNWLRNYLTDRQQQCVKVNNTYSSYLPVLSGVPQGSILGPLLFVMYINDLPTVLQQSEALIYADDTKIFRPISHVPIDRTYLQRDLTSIWDWIINNHLSINVVKTVCLVLGPRADDLFDPQYLLNNHTLAVTPSCRDLGITMASDLSWSEHYLSLVSSA